MQNRGGGTYRAAVRMDNTGLASIHVQINGQPLGLPTTLPVLPAELHSLVMVTFPNTETVAGDLIALMCRHGSCLYLLHSILLAVSVSAHAMQRASFQSGMPSLIMHPTLCSERRHHHLLSCVIPWRAVLQERMHQWW